MSNSPSGGGLRGPPLPVFVIWEALRGAGPLGAGLPGPVIGIGVGLDIPGTAEAELGAQAVHQPLDFDFIGPVAEERVAQRFQRALQLRPYHLPDTQALQPLPSSRWRTKTTVSSSGFMARALCAVSQVATGSVTQTTRSRAYRTLAASSTRSLWLSPWRTVRPRSANAGGGWGQGLWQ